MSKIIFDIETTGLSRTESSPIEFAFLEITDSGMPLRRGCMYIKPYKSEWTSGAEAVHHITKEMLEAHGVSPEYAAANIYALLYYNDIVTYNGKSFDMTLLRSFCDGVGAPLPLERTHLDLLYEMPKLLGGGKRKLVNLMPEIGVSEAAIAYMTKSLFGADGVYQAHDARYDCVETWYAYKYYLRMGGAALV